MSQINEQSWNLLDDIHRELDPPPEIEPEPVRVKTGGFHSKPRIKMERSLRERHRDREAMRRQIRNAPRSGEMRLKEFLQSKVAETGLTYHWIWEKFSNGEYGVTVRRVNARVMFVKPMKS